MKTIELKNISKDFKIGEQLVNILKPTTLTINEGEFIALIGPSGSGKSTLLTIIGALQKPTNGDLMINGKNISQLTNKELTQLRFDEIGFILQASNLVPYLTIQEQFELQYRFNKEKINFKKIDETLDNLGIKQLKHKYSEEISGGERQRAAVGLALIKEPKIILADEPTASLDTKKAFEIMAIFKEITEKTKTTIIVVTHDLRILDNCDRILTMNDGILSEQN
ncbi:MULTISPECIES: ABC transporter ATP-binding protein [Vagococcus]|uniref:Putative hemin import ATP-binding protein HrtA n=1 Tax=Vagococcus fluvialis bH819 TaxID=1255619 RepID=A0A1X6WMD5_9ENTE|nr:MULTISPECIES: ABC transporter ATP-binding protein [Vagococcus]SLM85425.1 ABC transporter ATP-binding protein [Vagococcus fluvialis bH819]HCM89282.1 ABC transporter ATP-binding protein [Vagococcus sp.]